MIIDEYGLSPIQEGMLFHHLSGEARGVDIEQIVVGYNEPLDIVLLERAWQFAVQRHTVLRTSFEWKRYSYPVQQVHDYVRLCLEVCAGGDDEAGFHEFLARDRASGFDLAHAPLVRLTLFAYDQQRYRLVWTVHHILLDSQAFVIVLNNVEQFYQKLLGSEPVVVEPGPTFRPYIEWLQSLDLEGANQFWADRLRGLAGPTPLLQDAQSPGGAFSGYGEEELRLSEDVTSALRGLVKRCDITLHTIVMGVWGLLLSRYSGDQDVLFGVTKTSRCGSIGSANAAAGLFLNTVPVRAKLLPETSIAAALQELRAEWLSLQFYEHTPLTKIKEASAFPPSVSLFESLVVFENQSFYTALAATTGCCTTRQWQLLEQTNFPLTFAVYGDPEMLLKLEFDHRKYTHATAQRLLRHARQLFESIATNPQQKISDLSLLTSAERQQLVVEWNATERAYSRETSLSALVEAQAQRTPDAIAVVDGEQRLTYRELNATANQIARFVMRHGAGPDVPVGIYCNRTAQLVAGILGILKAGSAYVPLDPNYPKERLRYVLKDVQAPIILTQMSLADDLPSFAGRLICLDGDWDRIARESENNPLSPVRPEHLAYVLFTSGSTGRPKGVALEHRTATTFIQWAIEVFTPQELAGVLFSTSVCFDVSMFEMFVTLSAGGKIILASNVLHLPTLAAKNEVALINAVPSAMAELVRAGGIPPSAKTVNLAGELLAEKLVEQIYATTNVDKVYNLYGPTETSYATYILVRRGCPVTIGRPIANTRVYVLDTHQDPVPIGVPGELHIAGDGVARGYLNRPELTSEKFIPDPFGREPGGRLYKTGDLARYLPDGNLQFLGRAGQQVKIRGYRIELGEIEAALNEQPGIKQAVVIAREDTLGDKRLVAYLVASTGIVPSKSELRTWLKQRLPDYMIPAAYVFLDQLPILANGKINRKALPAAEVTADWVGEEQYAAPRTPVEQQLASIWADVLHRQSIGIRENFFEIGGHSLFAMQILVRIRSFFDLDVPVSCFFHSPTIESLAIEIDGMRVSMHSEEDLLRILEGIDAMPRSNAAGE